MNENIDRFLAKVDKTTPTNEGEAADPVTATGQEDQWNEMAPGVDPLAYVPKPVPLNPIPLAPPISDTGKVPTWHQESSKSDREDCFAFPGKCGLLNLGNTCYMNAGLQCLFGVERIAKFYLSDSVPRPIMAGHPKSDPDKDEVSTKDSLEASVGIVDTLETPSAKETCNKEETGAANTSAKDEEKDKNKEKDVSCLCQGQISSSFSFLVRKLWAGRYSAIVPQNFKTLLGFIYSQFNGFRQQDCQEFLVVLLDRLHEELCQDVTPVTTGNNNNNTIITDTFQGELKNIVTCSRCGHVSTKIDPFVYLSVPVPHAHERQIEVVWSSSVTPSSRRTLLKCLVVVPKVSTVSHVKKALCDLIGGMATPDHVTLAHVKDGFIDITLTDSLSSSRIKDEDFLVYAFETDANKFTDTAVTSSHQDVSSSEPMDTMKEDQVKGNTAENIESMECETTPTANETSGGSGETGRKVMVMEWHTCGVCLEEMVDNDLLTHTVCGALLCGECLESSKQHTVKEDGRMPCPVCQRLIDHTKDFVPLAKNEETSEIVRLLQIPILFRQEDETGNWSLFGHPSLVNLPQNESIDYYYKTVSTLIPAHLLGQAWNLALTDGKGRYCSRCIYSAQSQCRGCILSNAMKGINLKPGDHLSISFRHLTDENVSKANQTDQHCSLSDSRWPSMVSLQDCLELFSQKEVLGRDNPWWCPECQSKQEAVRELVLSRLPPTLIIHLKRFLFQDSCASKVDIGISFPLSLSTATITSHTTPSQNCIGSDYKLTGCVCHFGTLNSGHYTAYSSHPVSGEWSYYNDETVTEKTPSDSDASNAYILFYTSTNISSDYASDRELPIERGVVSVNSDEELLLLEPVLRLMKPKPLPSAPPPPPLKRSSSTGNVADSIDQCNNQLSGLPPSSTSLRRPSSNSRISDIASNPWLMSQSTSAFKSFEV